MWTEEIHVIHLRNTLGCISYILLGVESDMIAAAHNTIQEGDDDSPDGRFTRQNINTVYHNIPRDQPPTRPDLFFPIDGQQKKRVKNGWKDGYPVEGSNTPLSVPLLPLAVDPLMKLLQHHRYCVGWLGGGADVERKRDSARRLGFLRRSSNYHAQPVN